MDAPAEAKGGKRARAKQAEATPAPEAAPPEDAAALPEASPFATDATGAPAVVTTEAPADAASKRGAKKAEAGKRGRAAPEAPSTEPTAEVAEAPAKRGAPKREDAAAEAPPARTLGPTVAQQHLVMTGGSSFLRAVGFIQREGGELVPEFRDVTVTKMASPALPTEGGTYEFRFKARNGTGDFDLSLRAENGTTSNKKRFEVSGTDALQTYRFTLS